MRKFFQSGAAFMVVALLCFASGALSALSDKGGGASFGVGLFWLIMAIVVRAKNTKKEPPAALKG